MGFSGLRLPLISPIQLRWSASLAIALTVTATLGAVSTSAQDQGTGVADVDPPVTEPFDPVEPAPDSQPLPVIPADSSAPFSEPLPDQPEDTFFFDPASSDRIPGIPDARD